MEQLAEPGKAYLTEHTASLVEGYLALTDLGEFQVKGASRALHVHELTGIGAARGRLDVSRSRGFSPFVGRDDELRMLESAREQALAGQPQVIGIVGEAGVGKSRLCDMFARRCRAKGIPVYHSSGQAHAKSIPLLPVLQIMRSYFDVTDLDSHQTARERIAGKLLLLDESFGQDLPLIFDFLGVADPERPSPRMDPEARQRQVLGITKRLVRAQSSREPGITLFEDLHWLDPASEVFVANHVEASQGTRGLTILNFRPEYRAAWMSTSYYRQIALPPLGPEAIEQMLQDLLGSHPSLDGLPDLVRERTAGNPFFIEEVVQSLVEAGSLEGERGAYRLVRPVGAGSGACERAGVLSARIDRLPEREKAVLQAAAVIGRECAAPVLARVVELERTSLEEALRNLVAGEFVFEQELYPEAIYAFKHPLTQEVAYGSQLGERRAALHAAVARAIAEAHPERLDERAALLAQHWESAGDTLEAARWNARAGDWTRTNDPTASLRHWRKVRELTDSLPESEETSALGLSARTFSHSATDGASECPTRRRRRFSRRPSGWRRGRRTSGTRQSCWPPTPPSGAPSMGSIATPLRLAHQAIDLAERSGDPALYMVVSGLAYSLLPGRRAQ